MQSELDRLEKELKEKIVQGSAGGGAVRVEVTGEGMIHSLVIAPEAVAAGDKAVLEETVLAAVRDALQRARALKKEWVQKAMGGLQLPGLF